MAATSQFSPTWAMRVFFATIQIQPNFSRLRSCKQSKLGEFCFTQSLFFFGATCIVAMQHGPGVGHSRGSLQAQTATPVCQPHTRPVLSAAPRRLGGAASLPLGICGNDLNDLKIRQVYQNNEPVLSSTPRLLFVPQEERSTT